MFGGINLLQGIVAALGAALFVGNLGALIRSYKPAKKNPSWSDRQNRISGSGSRSAGGLGSTSSSADVAPKPRAKLLPSLVMAVLGLVIFAWATLSLVRG